MKRRKMVKRSRLISKCAFLLHRCYVGPRTISKQFRAGVFGLVSSLSPSHRFVLCVKGGLLALALAFVPSNALANHFDPSCPDEHASGSESMTALLTRQSGEVLRQGHIIDPGSPDNKPLVVHAVATASGTCVIRTLSCFPCRCIQTGTSERLVARISRFVTHEDENGISTLLAPLSPTFGVDENGKLAFLPVLDSRNDNSTEAPIILLRRPGTYTFDFSSNIDDFCLSDPRHAFDRVMVYVKDRSQDKNLGCDQKNNKDTAEVGNPCNAATGNKYEIEVDYVSPHGAISFVRHYNSQFGVDLGLGTGWTTSHHRRLEIAANTIYVRRGDGRAEAFTNSAKGWQGDPDTTYI